MTIEEYIAAQEEAVQPALREIYRAIAAALPEAEQRIRWGMPTFWRGRDLIHFAPAKRHIGVYPGDRAVEAFRGELAEKGLRFSKGAIRFPFGNIDLGLIRRIAIWCGEHNA